MVCVCACVCACVFVCEVQSVCSIIIHYTPEGRSKKPLCSINYFQSDFFVNSAQRSIVEYEKNQGRASVFGGPEWRRSGWPEGEQAGNREPGGGQAQLQACVGPIRELLADREGGAGGSLTPLLPRPTQTGGLTD